MYVLPTRRMINLKALKRIVNKYFNRHGFTMIEMVGVLIVMAILAAGISSRVTTTGNELIVETEILKSHLRFAQLRAMNDTVSWGIHIKDASHYTLYRNGSQATDILPGESEEPDKPPQTRELSKVVTITANNLETYNFNEWGKPLDATGAESGETGSITLSQGTDSKTITITKNTGYIQ